MVGYGIDLINKKANIIINQYNGRRDKNPASTFSKSYPYGQDNIDYDVACELVKHYESESQVIE